MKKKYLHIINSVKEINDETVAAKGGGVILMAYLKAATHDNAPKVKSVTPNPNAKYGGFSIKVNDFQKKNTLTFKVCLWSKMGFVKGSEIKDTLS